MPVLRATPTADAVIVSGSAVTVGATSVIVAGPPLISYYVDCVIVATAVSSFSSMPSLTGVTTTSLTVW